MNKMSKRRKMLYALYVISALLVLHHFIARPVFLDWGASKDIKELSLPGDVLTTGARHTRAVLINSTPERIWPWIVQLGQERAGFYSHQWLENLFFADMKNVYSIESRFQSPRLAGDTIWLANKDNYNGQGYQIIAEVTPARSCVMVGGSDYMRLQQGLEVSGSWALYLHPQSDSTTWLIARSSSGDISMGEKVLRYFTFEVPHFIMEARMLKTIKKLSEKNG